MTKNSLFLDGLDNQKAFYKKMLKQLRSNKIMQRALQNADAREVFVEVLSIATLHGGASGKLSGNSLLDKQINDREIESEKYSMY